MKRKWFILILCTIFLCLQGICFAVEDFSDNLRPITKEQINTIETREDLKAEGILDTAFPKCYLKPTPVELVHKLGIPNYAEFKKSDGTMSPSALPQQVSLLDYMPSIGSQKYNSCASFSLGYYGISYWNFIDKGMSPTSNPQHLGSHMYIFLSSISIFHYQTNRMCISK